MKALAAAAALQLVSLSPDAPPVAPPAVAPLAVSAPLFDAVQWAALPEPDAGVAQRLAARAPWIEPQALREVGPAEALRLFGEAADRGLGLLDLFTDAGLRGRQAYYIAGPSLAAADAAFLLPLLYPVAGTASDGRPFRMIGIVLGLGHADVLYDIADFEYSTPWFPDYRYIAAGRVGQEISGAGDLVVEGLRVAAVFTPRVLRFTKVSTTQARVRTSVATKTVELHPIRRR